MFRHLTKLSLGAVVAVALLALGITPAFAKQPGPPPGASGKDTLESLECSDGQIAKFDGDTDAWECAADETGAGGGPRFVLKDANGNPFGTVIDAYYESATIEIQFQDVQSETITILTSVSPVQGFLNQGQFYHADANCNDPPMVFPRGLFRVAHAPFIIRGLGDVRSLYVASDGIPVSTLILASSSITDFGSGPVISCQSFGSGFTRDLVPPEELDSDLNTSFPPPYTLELQ